MRCLRRALTTLRGMVVAELRGRDVATPACAAVLRDAGGIQMRVSDVEVSRFLTVCEKII